jgi:HK97 family phage portal protein
MGLATWLGFKPKPDTPMQAWTAPTYELIPEGMSLDEYLKSTLTMPVEKLWREQPHLRTVVGFVARNIAQLGLHVFERDAEDGRNRVRAGPLVDLLDEPNNDVTTFELVESTVASRMLYDETYWYVARDLKAPSGWVIRHIPTSWIIGSVGATAFAVEAYKVAIPNTAGRWTEIPAEDMIVFHGWNPVDPKSGTSPVDSLKATLAEQIHAAVFRDQMWKRGGRIGNYIYRPKDAPWSKEARDGWVKEYQDKYSGDNGPRAGGEPLMEDGMEIKSVRFSAKDEQFVEASKLSLETCAQVYFINPTMVGVLDDANYSNVREFRKSLYGDTLGPEIERMQQRLNRKLVPRMADRRKTYVEFNLRAKLEGSFEEQGDLLGKAIGGPWMTINEGRAKQNMPRVDGGDDLIRPLNTTQNGDQNPIPAEPGTDPDETEGEKHASSDRNGRRVRVTL